MSVTKNFLNYFKRLLFIALALELIILFFFQKFSQYDFKISSYLIVFFILVSSFIHWVLLKACEKKPAQFVPYFTGTIGIKLLCYFSFIIIYLLINRSEAKQFVITFFVLYIVFTVYEVFSILGHVNSLNKKK